MKPVRSPALVIAIMGMTLPALYVLSYLTLVSPRPNGGAWNTGGGMSTPMWSNYRFGGKYSARLYWPLEQIDHWLRPLSVGRRPADTLRKHRA